MIKKYMSLNIQTLTAAILTAASSAAAQTPIATSAESIAAHLDTLTNYNATAKFMVSMPQMEDDIIYSLSLAEQSSPQDPYSTDSYIIDWTLENAKTNNRGFSAYFNGNHYRFSGQRLQEYHSEWDSVPFRPELIGSRSQGVQRSVQFFNLLPQAIATDVRKMISDPSYKTTFTSDTVVGGVHVAALRSIMEQNGLTAMEAEYLFDRTTGLPLRLRMENNPGSISEQSVGVDYSAATTEHSREPINEALLMDRYGDAFALYRESNFSIEKLPGQLLPAFALPTITGERYSRRSTDRFKAPTIVVLLESTGGFTPQVIEAVRHAADRMPVAADIIWAFTDNVADRIEPLTGEARIGETVLMSARSLVRDCGAASLPVVILTSSDGTVKNVILGFNNDLTSDVIQKMALVK